MFTMYHHCNPISTNSVIQLNSPCIELCVILFESRMLQHSVVSDVYYRCGRCVVKLPIRNYKDALWLINIL